MRASVAAGIVYAVVVFLVGFCVGAVRVLLVAPHVGEVSAVALEAPIMLAVSWIVAARSVQALRVPPSVLPRVVMGGVALVVLLLGEWVVAAAVFARSTAQFLGAYRTTAGGIGLLTQLAFAGLPLAQRPAST